MGTIIYSQDPNSYIAHHGILGMHWGIRRYQPYPKDYKGSGKEIGEAKKVKPRKEEKYERKEIARTKTYMADFGRKAMITALATVGGVSIGVGTANPILGAAGMGAISVILRASPVGKKVVYYKN